MYSKKEWDKEYSKIYYKKNKEKIDENQKIRIKNLTKEDRKKKALYVKEWKKKTEEKIKASISEEEWNIRQNKIIEDRKNNRKQKRDKNPQEWDFKMRVFKLKANFNLTLKDYNNLLEKQNNVCAICGKEEVVFDKRANKIKALAVDHNHETGQVRGLLCNNCNQALGKFKDNIIYLQNAIKYLNN